VLHCDLMAWYLCSKSLMRNQELHSVIGITIIFIGLGLADELCHCHRITLQGHMMMMMTMIHMIVSAHFELQRNRKLFLKYLMLLGADYQ